MNNTWVSITEELPNKYEDVFILMVDDSICIGRINHHGVWLKASYQKTKYQYGINKENIRAWCRHPEIII